MTSSPKKPPVRGGTPKTGKARAGAVSAPATKSAAELSQVPKQPQNSEPRKAPRPPKALKAPSEATQTVGTEDVEKKKPGCIDLIGLFEAEARALSSAVSRGQLLHATHNIAESGGPLESAVRDFLTRMLPSKYGVETGYFFDVASTCTPQIDVMIINMADRHQFLASPDRSVYLPFTASRAVIEVKNSAYDITKALNQIGAINDSLNAMWSAVPSRSRGGEIADPLSILLFAGTGSVGTLKQVQEWYANNEEHSRRPSYVVFLEQGIVITRLSGQDTGDYSNCVSLTTSDSATRPFICIPAPQEDFLPGRTLMWIYFALVTSLSEREHLPAQILKFSDNFQQKFSIFPVIALDEAKNWKSLQASIQTWRSNKKTYDKTNSVTP